MQKLFLDTRTLDGYVRDTYGLTEDVMMENAAMALENAVMKHAFHESGRYITRPCVLILAGKGNNGADGYALARRINSHELSVTVCEESESTSSMALLQKKRAEKIGVRFINLYELDDFIEEKSFDITVVVDCLYGSGFHLPLNPVTEAIINSVSKIEAYKISCDVPTGLDSLGNGNVVFRADETVTMGALKYCLFTDNAKDFVGKITVCNLGVSECNFAPEGRFRADACLLEKSEMILPFRNKKNVHKGCFGHVAVVSGEKKGASMLSSLAALNFGSGLVTLVGRESESFEIMSSEKFPENANSIVLGPGLGRNNEKTKCCFDYLAENQNIGAVLDADAFYYPEIKNLLEKRKNENTILTPHPKEFSALLENTGFGKFTVKEILERKLELASLFVSKYKNVVLLLKGAVQMLARFDEKESCVKIYLNPNGSSSLSKGGSGDVLSGLLASLLAQGYNCINAAVSASLALTSVSLKFENSFSLTMQKLIESIGDLR